MSTSPSWFDQEKFSRLVKKVGPKTVAETLPSTAGTDSESRPATGEVLASTARISLVSKPPSLLSEQRALPALPRRMPQLPNLRRAAPLPETPAASPSVEAAPVEAKELPVEQPASPTPVEKAPFFQAPKPAAVASAAPVAPMFDGDALSQLWHKMALLNDELAHTIMERDHAMNEIDMLRERLGQIEYAMRVAGQ